MRAFLRLFAPASASASAYGSAPAPARASLTATLKLTVLVGVLGAFGAGGCAKVAPYERGTLAHPTMSADDAMSSRLDEHVRGVSEGAAGGLSGGGGGCGCN